MAKDLGQKKGLRCARSTLYARAREFTVTKGYKGGREGRTYLGEETANDFLDALRDDGIAERRKTVHSFGYPMSHSTHVGFNWPPTCVGSISDALWLSELQGERWSLLCGVGYSFTARLSWGFPLR